MIDHRTKKHPAVVFSDLGLVHCLGTTGIPVYTASESDKSVSASSRYSDKHFRVPSYDSPRLIDRLCEIGEGLDRKGVLMSHDDRVLHNISENRERLSEYFLFRMPERRMVDQLLNKMKFCRLCEEYDLPAPGSLEVSGEEDLERVRGKIQPPFLIKPVYRHHWYKKDFIRAVGYYQKAYVCTDFEELQALYRKIATVHPEVVIQEFIVGDDQQMYDVNLHITGSGETDGYVICRKLRVYPPVAGWTCYAKTIHDEEIYRYCSDLVRRLDLKGLINIQIKQDVRSRELKLIEIHTRTSILDYQGAAAGQNLPARYYSNLTGTAAGELLPYRDDVGYVNMARDLRLFIRYRKKYNVPFMKWVKSYTDNNVYDGMLLQDPKVLLKEFYSVFNRQNH